MQAVSSQLAGPCNLQTLEYRCNTGKKRMQTHRLSIVLLITLLTSIVVVGEDNRSSPDNQSFKPRIINTTDLGADPDDEQSMVRQLVCANEFEIEGLIVATGCWKKDQSDTKMLDKIVDAYGLCVDNLKVHAEGFPSFSI